MFRVVANHRGDENESSEFHKVTQKPGHDSGTVWRNGGSRIRTTGCRSHLLQPLVRPGGVDSDRSAQDSGRSAKGRNETASTRGENCVYQAGRETAREEKREAAHAVLTHSVTGPPPFTLAEGGDNGSPLVTARDYFPAIAPTSDWKILIPSVQPSSGSAERSGCGIMPRTLRPGLQMPAMFSSEPLGLASGVISPCGVE